MTDIRRDIVTGALAESADALNALRNNAATLDAIMAAGALLAETLSGRGACIRAAMAAP